MNAIALLIRIDGDVEEVYRKVATLDGIAAWFAEANSEDYAPGNRLRLFSKDSCEFDVVSMKPNLEIEWDCVSEGNIWTNTKIRFTFERGDSKTFVRFDHSGWPEVTDIYRDCAMSWAYFLESLKLLVETGKGTPEAIAPPCEIDSL